MKAEDVKVYREIQRNAEKRLKAIETISEKLYDDTLALQVSRQMIKYSDLRGRALEKLLQGKAEPYKKNMITDAMVMGEIHTRTLIDNSTSHIAQLLIEGSNRNITEMCRALNHNPLAGAVAVEMAKELMEFEGKNIDRMKKFL